MQNWRAVTSSGRVYNYRQGIFTIEGDPYTAFKVWTMKAATMDDDALVAAGAENPWVAGTTQWEDVKVPVVGRRLYLSGKDNWRLSTMIQSVELLPDDERNST